MPVCTTNWYIHHRIPISGGIDAGCLGGTCSRGCPQIHGLSGRGGYRFGIAEPVAADPDAVAGIRQIRNQIAAIVFGHDDAGEAGRQIGGFRDDPDSGLRSPGTPDDAADVVGIEGDAIGGNGLGGGVVGVGVAVGAGVGGQIPQAASWAPVTDCQVPVPLGLMNLVARR